MLQNVAKLHAAKSRLIVFNSHEHIFCHIYAMTLEHYIPFQLNLAFSLFCMSVFTAPLTTLCIQKCQGSSCFPSGCGNYFHVTPVGHSYFLPQLILPYLMKSQYNNFLLFSVRLCSLHPQRSASFLHRWRMLWFHFPQDVNQLNISPYQFHFSAFWPSKQESIHSMLSCLSFAPL